MSWVYGHYKYFNSYSGIDFRRQNLTSTDVRFWWRFRVKLLCRINAILWMDLFEWKKSIYFACCNIMLLECAQLWTLYLPRLPYSYLCEYNWQSVSVLTHCNNDILLVGIWYITLGSIFIKISSLSLNVKREWCQKSTSPRERGTKKNKHTQNNQNGNVEKPIGVDFFVLTSHGIIIDIRVNT